jgi:hypothetical protein
VAGVAAVPWPGYGVAGVAGVEVLLFVWAVVDWSLIAAESLAVVPAVVVVSDDMLVLVPVSFVVADCVVSVVVDFLWCL